MSFERKFCWIQVREIFSRVLSIATVLNAETFEGFINVEYFLSSNLHFSPLIALMLKDENSILFPHFELEKLVGLRTDL